MGILQDTREVALVQAFAVATQQCRRAFADREHGRRHVVLHRGRNGLADQIERFVAREALAHEADGVTTLCGTRRLATRHFGCSCNDVRRRSARRLTACRTFAASRARTVGTRALRARRRCGVDRHELGRRRVRRHDVAIDRDNGCVGGISRIGGCIGAVGGHACFTVTTTASTTATATTTRATLLTVFLLGGFVEHACDIAAGNGRRGAGIASRRCDLELAVLESRQREQPLLRCLLHEFRELRHAEILLVEAVVDVLHDLLEAIGAHDVAIAHHAGERLGDELPRVALDRLLVAGLHQAGERIVTVVFVAIHHQQVAGALANAHADDVLAVLLELHHHAREIGVTRKQNEGADLGTREHEFHGVDGEADVGGVLLRAAVRRRHDHVDRRLGKRHDILRVAAPVGIGPLHGDLALDDVRRQEILELRLQVGADPHRDVVEIDEERGVRCVAVLRVAGGGRSGGVAGLRPAVHRGDGPSGCVRARRASVHVTGDVKNRMGTRRIGEVPAAARSLSQAPRPRCSGQGQPGSATAEVHVRN